MGIIIEEIVNIFKKLLKILRRYWMNLEKLSRCGKHSKKFSNNILEKFGEILKKCEYWTSFGKNGRIFLNFFNKFREIFQM